MEGKQSVYKGLKLHLFFIRLNLPSPQGAGGRKQDWHIGRNSACFDRVKATVARCLALF